MKFTPEQISNNYTKFIDRINKIFKSRADAINNMYSQIGEDRVMLAPASSFIHFHNALPGGYVDHILRVMDFSIMIHKQWESAGLKTDNYTLEELLFAAMHHDLGKLGLPGNGKEHYIINDSAWHVKNQGKIYKSNPDIPKIPVTDKGFYLLNHYQIQYSINEMIGIRCTDGLYEESNKAYLTGFDLESKLRCNMPVILHQADMMAARFEFERWAVSNKTFKMNN